MKHLFLFRFFAPVSTLISISTPIVIESFPAQAQSSGCGSGWTWYITPNAPSGVDFGSACNRHDDCYDTLNADKGRCDAQFHNDMLTACREAFPDRTVLGIEYRHPQRITCNGAADTYYQAVKTQGDKAYQDAQRNAKQERQQQESASRNTNVEGIVLRNQWSGKCLQTMGQDRDNGSPVNIWDCTNTSNQFWTLSDRGELRNSWSSKCLQTMGQDSENGSTVNIWECTGTSNQFWERTSSGEFRNRWSGKCLQTMGQDSENGSTVNIWECTDTSNQAWR